MKLIHGSIEMARRNLAEYDDAKLVSRSTIKKVSRWIRIPDKQLAGMVPPPEVPRAFNSSFEGCPIHGKDLFRFGNYSWIMDPFKRPWKLKCPVGGEEYPSNDFQRYLDSGMRDRSMLTGDFTDDGWGWRKEGDLKKHWFVAYYCHWFWYSYLIPAVLDLSRAYVLTSDGNYARKCLILLDKIAEYYPSMNYNKQSRYAQEFAPTYDGKIVNRIWETNVIKSLAESVANLRGYITDETAGLLGKECEELTKFLDENLLVEGLGGIYDGRIVGNYGMQQDAMLVVLKALDKEEETKKGLDLLINNPGGGYGHQGIRYAMDNFIYREGISFENAPGYCFTWSRNLLSIATHLWSMGVQFPEVEKLKSMLEAPDRITCQGKFTPAIGDSGSVTSEKIQLSGGEAARAYRIFRSPLFAKLAKPGFSSYEELFLPRLTEDELREASSRHFKKRSDCLGGYGLVILRSKDLECSMFFGRRNGHGHHDRLAIEIFGCGQRVTPDLGYPQFASESKAPPAWERNTISHNTVTVNEKKQDTGSAGWLRMFHSDNFVQMAEASANRTYIETSLYMRTIALINHEDSFFLDIFRVRGGHAHDYSIHGHESEFKTKGIQLRKREGTLAGPDIPYSYLYDDPELEKPDKTRSFYSYSGSGYSYLYDIMVGIPERPWWAQWRSPKAFLRIFFPQRSDETIVASGNPPIRPGNPPFLRYVILRNRGQDLESVFTAVGQVWRETGSVRSTKAVKVECEGKDAFPVGILIEQGDVRHLVISSIYYEAEMRTEGVQFKGRFLVLTTERDGRPLKVFMDGSRLTYDNLDVQVSDRLRGTIREVDHGEDRILVDFGEVPIRPEAITGEMTFIQNGKRSSCFKILGAEEASQGIYIKLERGGRVGRLMVEKAGEREVRTETKLQISGHGYYEGAYLIDRGQKRSVLIESVEEDTIHLAEPLGEFALPEAYIWEYRAGDEITIGTSFSMRRRGSKWRGRTNIRTRLVIDNKTRSVGPGRFVFTQPKTLPRD